MGLHLGWIPNEPGLRRRDFWRSAPKEPTPDPAKVAALHAAHHHHGLWTRLLIVIGLFAFLLFGLIAGFTRDHWAWAVAAGLALCCWLPVVLLALNRRRAAAHLRTETELQAQQHATELAEYEQGKEQWARSEAVRIATAPRWLQVAAHEDVSRLDVFGGTGWARQNMVTGLGWELLGQQAVIVLDLSQDRVADGLLAAAARAGISSQDYELPRDLAATPLLAGLGGEQIASLIVEVVHADDASATAAGRATDLMILKKITGVLGADVSTGRLHAALTSLLGHSPAPGDSSRASDTPAASGSFGTGDSFGTTDSPAAGDGLLAAGERARLHALFGDGFRQQVAGNLVRLAAVVEPLTALGSDPGQRPPARLTCLSLADGPRDVATDLTAALVVQWVTRAVSADPSAAGSGPRPAVILAGADEQSTRHLARLTAVCERYGIPLVRAFSRLTEESARHLDTRHTAFMRLATRPEALRAAEHIGLERRFVAGRFAHRHSVSRSHSRSTSESLTHTTGRTEGEATTHTTGTTTGQAYSEAEVPRQEQQQVHVQVENHHPRDAGDRGGSDGGRAASRQPSSREQAGGDTGAGKAADRGTSDPRPRGGSGSGQGSGSSRVSVRSGGGKSGRPRVDIMRTRTRFTMQHESDAKTKSWSTTEEESRTSTTAESQTDGVSVGDEISYELVYDHKVQPETLMALPEDQMLAPQIVEATAAVSAPAADAGAAHPGAAGKGVAGGRPQVTTESKMVALIINPAVIGSEPVAAVRPGEIPAFEPPTPEVSAQVPDYQRVKRPALGGG
jgi:hypothetical protein